MTSIHGYSFGFWCIALFSLSIITECAPSHNPEDVGNQPLTSPTPRSMKRVSIIQSALGGKRRNAGDLDPQTQNDMRILSLFEHELNKIFSCYFRLSCPRTRSPQVISECDELRNWPLYHQVMRMAEIKRYPYQNYAPQPNALNIPNTGSIPFPSRNHLTSEGDEDNVQTRRQQRSRQRRTNTLHDLS